MAEVTAAAAEYREAPPFSGEQKQRIWSTRKSLLRPLHDRLLKIRLEIRVALAVMPVPDDWVNEFWANFAAQWFDAEACEFAAFGPTGVELSRWLENESKEMCRWLDNPSKRQTERLRDLGVPQVLVKAKISERVTYWTNDRCSERSFAKRVGRYVHQNWPAQARLATAALEGIAQSGRIPSADDVNREMAAATGRLARGFLDSELDALAAEEALVSEDACRQIAKNAASAILDELKGVATQPWFIEPLHLLLKNDWWTAGHESVQRSIGVAQIEACSKQFSPLSERSAKEEVEPHHKDFLERLSEDESNKDATGILYEAWADSHGLVADAHAGSVSVSDFVDGCVNSFAQGAEAQIAFKDDTSILGKCKELDRMAEEFIRMFTQSIEAEPESLGNENVEAAVDHLSRRVNEIAARSKQRVFQEALAGLGSPPRKSADLSSPVQAGDTPDVQPNLRDLAHGGAMDHSDLPEAYRDLIAAAELDAQSILEASQKESNFLKAQAYDLGVSASDIDLAPGNTVLKLAEEKIVQGRGEAADHLLRIVAVQYWKWLQPDIDRFMAELEIRWRLVYQTFQVDPRMSEDTKRAWKVWALKERAAASEHNASAERSGAATTTRPQLEAGGTVHSQAKAPMDLPDSTQASGEGAIKNPFRQGAKEHPQLVAHWDARREVWSFREQALDENGKPAHGFTAEPADPKTSDLFAQAVRTAFGLLRNSQDPPIRALITTLREPYQVWLDLMRNEKRGFERVVQLRTGHWSVYVRAQEASTPLPPSATLLLDDGDIRGVFAQSATFWDDIAARAATPKPFDGSSDSESDDRRKALAAARRAVVMPILKARRWSRGKWVTAAAVGKNCIYEYLDGKRNPGEENRRAMAEALDLKPEDLPG
jgi:hypothetical protein